MTGHHETQRFHFGPWVFSIAAAEALLAATPRDQLDLDVKTWATAYGLAHLDDPHRTAVTLIGPTPGSVDRAYAMTTNLTTPVILAQISINGSPPAPLLIDGIHRLYHAWHDGMPRLPAHLLSVEETRRIQHDVLLGPGRTRITPPHA